MDDQITNGGLGEGGGAAQHTSNHDSQVGGIPGTPPKNYGARHGTGH